MNPKNYSYLLLPTLSVLTISGCLQLPAESESSPSPNAVPSTGGSSVPTSTPRPTSTPVPVPTATPRPTSTPVPAPTATPRPTSTPVPVPTATVVPTATPAPTGVPQVVNYYLAPKSLGGNDSNPGTIDRPFFSLEKLWTVLQPGNLVYLRGGTYEFDYEQYLYGKSGTANNLIKIWAYPGETPIFTASALYYNASQHRPDKYYQDLIEVTGSYIHWKGIEIANFSPRDAGWRPFRVENSQNCIFELLNVHHNVAGMGIRGASGGNLVLNSDFHHNQDPPPLGDYDGADGLDIVFIAAGQTANTIRGCRAWYNADDGFDAWANDSHLIIENSWSFYNGYISDTFNTAGNGSGFKLGMASSLAGNLRTVTKNIAYKNRMWGFVENQAVTGHLIYNNTAAQNGEPGGLNFWFGSWGASRATVKNNISYMGGTLWDNFNSTIFSDISVVDHNSWDTSGVTLTSSDFQSLDASQLLRARKADGSLPDIDFLKPALGSDLIDHGASVGLPFMGTAPDLGAIER